jgi:hypothetical protein
MGRIRASIGRVRAGLMGPCGKDAAIPVAPRWLGQETRRRRKRRIPVSGSGRATWSAGPRKECSNLAQRGVLLRAEDAIPAQIERP